MVWCIMVWCIMVHCILVRCAMVHGVMVHCIMVRDGGPEGLGSASYSYGGVTQTFFLLANTPTP